jgi:hypothetical protein
MFPSIPDQALEYAQSTLKLQLLNADEYNAKVDV